MRRTRLSVFGSYDSLLSKSFRGTFQQNLALSFHPPYYPHPGFEMKKGVIRTTPQSIIRISHQGTGQLPLPTRCCVDTWLGTLYVSEFHPRPFHVSYPRLMVLSSCNILAWVTRNFFELSRFSCASFSVHRIVYSYMFGALVFKRHLKFQELHSLRESGTRGKSLLRQRTPAHLVHLLQPQNTQSGNFHLLTVECTSMGCHNPSCKTIGDIRSITMRGNPRTEISGWIDGT
jgi:hypothetical protein